MERIEDEIEDVDIKEEMEEENTKLGFFSLANIQVSQTTESFPIEKTIGPGFLGEEDPKENQKKNTKRRKGKAKGNSKKSNILQEAIRSLFPDVDDPGEAMRLAKAASKQTGDDTFLTESYHISTIPGREKILPKNNDDDLPIYVKGILEFVVTPEFEKAKYRIALRKNDKNYLNYVHEKQRAEALRRKESGIGSTHPKFPFTVGHREGLSHSSFQITFRNKGDDIKS